MTSLSVETMVLAPVARRPPWCSWASAASATLTSQGAGHFWLLVASGVITAVPLLFFGASARRLPMTTIGLLQYFAPVLQFIVALVVFREAMTPDRWIGFGVVWLALLVLTVDMLRATRKNSVAKRRTGQAAAPALAGLPGRSPVPAGGVSRPARALSPRTRASACPSSNRKSWPCCRLPSSSIHQS